MRGESKGEALKLEKNQETRKNEGWNAVATKVGGHRFTHIAEKQKMAAGWGRTGMYKRCVLNGVIQIAERNQPRLALRFMTIRVPVPVRGKPVQRKLL